MATEEQFLEIQIATYLAEVALTHRPPQMRRAFASDVAQVCAFLQAPMQPITVEVLRKFFQTQAYSVLHLALSINHEHLDSIGKRGKRRTILLDYQRQVQHLQAHLKRIADKHGLLFRSEKNGCGGPLCNPSLHERWDQSCSRKGVACTLHQCRHTHATESVKGGISFPTMCKRQEQKNLQTTLRSAEQSDKAACAEMRSWRSLQLHRTSR